MAKVRGFEDSSTLSRRKGRTNFAKCGPERASFRPSHPRYSKVVSVVNQAHFQHHGARNARFWNFWIRVPHRPSKHSLWTIGRILAIVGARGSRETSETLCGPGISRPGSFFPAVRSSFSNTLHNGKSTSSALLRLRDPRSYREKGNPCQFFRFRQTLTIFSPFSSLLTAVLPPLLLCPVHVIPRS